MRINVFVAKATGLSRRAADQAIFQGRVAINGNCAEAGQQINSSDVVTLDERPLSLNTNTLRLILNKPSGYVCSRNGQGSKTIYDLLPKDYHHLKPVGRLDKDSSGLILLTNDGQLAQQLTHPSFRKKKVYKITLDKTLTNKDMWHIERGVRLEDGVSRLILDGRDKYWTVTMSEGRNRQIRRTFGALGYRVILLHRTHFGEYLLGDLPLAKYTIL